MIVANWLILYFQPGIAVSFGYTCQGVARGLGGGGGGVQRGFAPPNPLATPYEPPMNPL